MTTTPKFYNADGSLTRYGFACGYTENADNNGLHLSMWLEHNCWHVRLHSETTGRVFWDTFDNNQLTQARKRYNDAKRTL